MAVNHPVGGSNPSHGEFFRYVTEHSSDKVVMGYRKLEPAVKEEKVKEFISVINELASSGLKLSRLSEYLGMCPNALHSAVSAKTLVGDLDKLERFLKVQSRALKSFSPKKYSVPYICNESLIKEAHLARLSGVSKQAFNSATGIPEHRTAVLTKEIRAIGKKFETLASRVEKIKK